MLKEVLCISGKAIGLYKLISYGKNLVIVESLVDHKRQPAHSRDKIISLGEMLAHTPKMTPLSTRVPPILEKYDGKKAIDSANYKTAEALDELFRVFFPTMMYYRPSL